ncbi:MAG TPA: hypothetical protein VGC75_06850 [Candidatus Nitrosocosmicus sp.]|jgi:hypothetical protein
MFAVVAVELYIAIDSKWAEENNASIWLTICFFTAASATILCGLRAIETSDGGNTIKKE